MASYYYVMAQLPSLSLQSDLPFSYKEFLDMISGLIPVKDKNILLSITLEPEKTASKTGSSFLDAWYAYERGLRFSLEKLRSENLNWKSSESFEGRVAISEALDTVMVARKAMAIDDPLKASHFLNLARFSAAEQLSGLHSFDREALFAYAVMLRLKEEVSFYNKTAGRSEYDTIYKQILEN